MPRTKLTVRKSRKIGQINVLTKGKIIMRKTVRKGNNKPHRPSRTLLALTEIRKYQKSVKSLLFILD
jgi:hypothetical protein